MLTKSIAKRNNDTSSRSRDHASSRGNLGMHRMETVNVWGRGRGGERGEASQGSRVGSNVMTYHAASRLRKQCD